ncbi:MAG: hypothetical protein P8181_12895 [bacterium]
MSGALKDVVWKIWADVAKRTARAYVPGPSLEDALRVCRWASDQSLASTIGFWDGEKDTPAEVVEQYVLAASRVAHESLDSYISIKAPSFEFDLGLLKKVVGRSAEADIRVHFDSLKTETADETFALIGKVAARGIKIGCTLPARWVRSLGDVERAVDMGLSVRVVKGQWADPTAPTIDVCKNFLAIIDRLAGRVPGVAVATHDVHLARESLGRLQEAGAYCEAELLFGLPVRPVMRTARGLGIPVRLYVPYGEGYLPYTLSQARQRPRIFWWIVRDTLLARTLFVPRSYRSDAS